MFMFFIIAVVVVATAGAAAIAGPFLMKRKRLETGIMTCDHGVEFPDDLDGKVLASLSASEIREMWPRLDGECPKGCGYRGLAYASYKHYTWGDW